MATISPTIKDLHWASGFLEGEGAFMYHHSTQRISAGQAQQEPLTRLGAMFGGTIYRESSGAQYQWQINGALARGVMMTLFAMMSSRRKEQIRMALEGRN